MYTNLIGELAKARISFGTISKLLGVHRNTVSNKIYGITQLSIDEAILIADTYFPECDIKWLFRKADQYDQHPRTA